MNKNYNSKEELIARINLSMARKNEYVARVQREWAEHNVERFNASAQ